MALLIQQRQREWPSKAVDLEIDITSSPSGVRVARSEPQSTRPARQCRAGASLAMQCAAPPFYTSITDTHLTASKGAAPHPRDIDLTIRSTMRGLWPFTKSLEVLINDI
jgi:hypothetical protein